jgi:uncharacterized repeat protein (TIGR03803 family)
VAFELSPGSSGWTESVLHTFNGADGQYLSAGFTADKRGNLYSTTPNGGSFGGGTVFELVRGTRGWKYKALYNFECNTEVHTGGEASAAPIFDAKGNLYGTNPCNSYKDGLVYELVRHKDGSSTYKDLWDFTDGLDGGKPAGALVFDKAGNLYGTTEIGGKYDKGTVFKLAPTVRGQWKESVLHSFKGGTSDGNYPYSTLIFDAAGNLYGTTYDGGSSSCAGYGCGTVFKLTPISGGRWKEKILYAFTGSTDGAHPDRGSLVMDASGNLYGTTVLGGRETAYSKDLAAAWCLRSLPEAAFERKLNLHQGGSRSAGLRQGGGFSERCHPERFVRSLIPR